MTPSTSAAFFPSEHVDAPRTRPLRAALLAALLACCAGACLLPLAQLTHTMHVHVQDQSRAYLPLLLLAPAVLALFAPLGVAVRQHFIGRRALPWLLVAALGPLAVLAILGVTVVPVMFCIGCCNIQ